jgi:predicted CopG family antitoxin
MNAPTLIYIVAFLIVSISVIFLFTLLKPNVVTKEKLEKILGEDAVEKLKNAKDENEMKQIIRALPKKRRTKLKVLLESQDIRDAIKAINEHIRN